MNISLFSAENNKAMKNIILLLLTLILSWTEASSQTIENDQATVEQQQNPYTNDYSALTEHTTGAIDFDVAQFDFDCSTDFFTIDHVGVIQRWTIIDNNVVGGDTILTGGGKTLSYCGDPSSPTFYCGKSITDEGLIYYDSLNGWTDIPINLLITNTGGYENNHFLMETTTGGYKRVYHFDGTELSLIIDNPYTTNFAVADIAVDTLGQAWIFFVDMTTDSIVLNVYNSSGLELQSFHVNMNLTAYYGSFFLNNTLYIGTGASDADFPNSIVPIVLNGDIAQLGSPIPFVNMNFSDMATCNSIASIMTPTKELSKSEHIFFPNPTKGILNMTADIDISKVEVFDLNGRLMAAFGGLSQSIDLSGFENGVYIVRVATGQGFVIERVIKN